ncbi:MAG TPA: AAA family ATPase [Devosiaceae bacterium]|jgi:adenylate kinase family enzyme|nr:AAA family ATPase [Devosiaceae bacterium]
MEVLPLEQLGPRIMICGPSNAGKSTLAQAMGQKLDLPVVHLDQLRFVPNSNWVLRPEETFAAAHVAAVAGNSWIIEGNYFGGIGARIERATGIIQLHDRRSANAVRYVRRTLFDKHRAGHLEGGRDSLKWELFRWILWEEPRRHAPRRDLLRGTGLPYVASNSMQDLRALYRAWELPQPR